MKAVFQYVNDAKDDRVFDDVVLVFPDDEQTMKLLQRIDDSIEEVPVRGFDHWYVAD